MDRVDRGLSLSHGIGRRRLHHFKLVPGLWLHAVAASGTFCAARFAMLHAHCSYSLAVASRPSRACLQRNDNAAHDFRLCGLRLCGWFLYYSTGPRDLVCISTPHRAPGTATDWDIALVLQHLVARIL